MLPTNIFGPVDGAALERATNQIHSMSDLEASVAGISWATAEMDSHALAGYNNETARHINRGIALVNLLLEQAAPGYHATDNTEEFANALLDGRDRSADHETFVDASAALRVAYARAAGTEARLSDIQTSHDAAYTVLDRAGIVPELFVRAVENLSGLGLETPTRLQEASFGAAVHVINSALSADL